MKQRIHINHLLPSEEEVRVSGFIQSIRDQGKIVFLTLRDITGTLQIVITDEELIKKTQKYSLESVIEVRGIVVSSESTKTGIELQAISLELLSLAEPELPIPVVIKSGEETELPKRLDWRWIDLRKEENSLIFKVWTTLEHAFREYCVTHGFIEIHSPKLMSTASESGAELFEVKYFDNVAYLAQSPQFYKQMAMTSGFERVFEVGPVFRANPSFTVRHDTEFTGYDCEISYIDSHHDVMKIESELLAHSIAKVKELHGDEIKHHHGRELVIPTLPFPTITLSDAKIVLQERGISSDEPGDLSPEEERELSAYILEKYNHEFVFVTDYPARVRAFYHMRHEDDPSLTKSFDLLWNGIEITTGAQREHRYEKLCEQVREKGLSEEPLKNYLNFFRYGCPPHGGFGIGPTRLLMKIFNIKNVREVTYVYRGPKRLDP